MNGSQIDFKAVKHMESTNNNKDFTMYINGHCVEYFDDGHDYLIDGVLKPSITSLFHKDFSFVPPDVLQEAARKGTELHQAIEDYCRYGTESDLVEVEHFKEMMQEHKFEVLENEVPVILFNADDEPIAAGRVDMVIKMGDEIGGADIKRVSRLDKKALTLQLNLYRIAYRQSYGTEWKFLKGIHLKESTKRFVDITIDEAQTREFIEEVIE